MKRCILQHLRNSVMGTEVFITTKNYKYSIEKLANNLYRLKNYNLHNYTYIDLRYNEISKEIKERILNHEFL